MSAPLKVWDWRDAVRQSRLEPHTKLVLYTIAVYMNGMGAGAFPSYKALAADTGLARRTVIACVGKAVQAGFLAKERAQRPDGSQSTNRYAARYPDNVVVPHEQAQDVQADVQPVEFVRVPFQNMPEGVVQPTTLGWCNPRHP
jgi:hypothetical protein